MGIFKKETFYSVEIHTLLVHLYLTETGEVERFISSATMVIAEEVLIVEDL